MEIKVLKNDNIVIELKGRLDTTTSPQLDQKVKEIEIDKNLVIIDFKELEYISSAGLRVLLAIKKMLEASGKKLEIHNVNEVILEVFNVTGFINVLNVK
ncbi:MAG: STAS domain-containing protein [Acholeplasmatales bacterium]|nr:STAS domain-containing protein [Acholeplasmatales bacterium]